ncbi:dynein axonemal assembly factor 4-like [Ischnura elegans]|uniref:dynein axonemal assembly factor 4-like n=1 Tax=Ischnura elegans TaxID=197161 RepID=UPI001ED88592|nr:dynein axonemal assembly factor 4-like [Ischnura elegans]
MPIIMKDFSWRQTDSTIIIRVPCKKDLAKNVDFISSSCYIKASYPPYIFELFLVKEINELESSCIKGEDELIFTLVKANEEVWDLLEKDLTKIEKREQREIILKDIATKYERLSNEKSERKATLHRQAVRQQISIDERNRKKIDEMKNNERQKLAGELEDMKQRSNNRKPGDKTETNKQQNVRKQIDAPIRPKDDHKQKKETVSEIPPPRKSATIQVKFSERFFPTPSRESMAAEEEEWLRKQAEARRLAGFDDKDLSLEEKDPMWLKEKGDLFFKLGNYHGAIAAYTHGIKLSGQMSALYSNRAAAHIALGNFFKAAEDASMALELITPHTPSNALARARCHSKRGAAFWKLGLLDKGLIELCAARDLLKHHDKENRDLLSLEKDIETITKKIEDFSDDEEADDENIYLVDT